MLDTAAFIKQVRFERIGKEFYTIPAVVNEIRDENAKAFYQNFPFEIVLKEPHPLAFKAGVLFCCFSHHGLVADFARKTGDYSSLSSTDLKVLALQYTLEREANGNVDHLRTEPQQVSLSYLQLTVQPEESPERPNIFFSPTKVEGKPVGVGDWGDGGETGWISPDNVQGYTESFTETLGDVKTQDTYKVACLTLDFAMQVIWS